MPEAGKNGTIVLKGLSGYMVQLLSQGLGFKSTIHVPSDGNWGGRRPDGSWGGQVGLVVRNVCNVAAGPMAMNADRVGAMQPLPAFYYADGVHMAGRRQMYSTDVFGYIYAFDEQAQKFVLAKKRNFID
ncbi:probable glutamate receptor [Ixodes scapularis]|uniref:probable glutamate receptor n=1 Tax=Ixodes scapularis TaxID=6945 RepID=UPI001C38267B|nr:probable glutamate receptor [Ixodes scapularis]